MKKKNEIIEGMTPALAFGAFGTGASILGGKLQPLIPAGTINPLTSTGSVMGDFAGPVATLGAFAITTNQLKKAEKKLQGGKK